MSSNSQFATATGEVKRLTLIVTDGGATPNYFSLSHNHFSLVDNYKVEKMVPNRLQIQHR